MKCKTLKQQIQDHLMNARLYNNNEKSMWCIADFKLTRLTPIVGL